MDGSTIKKQFIAWGFGRNKRRHTVQSEMSPWKASSRVATADGMNNNLHGDRRISNSESCVINDGENLHEIAMQRRKRNTGKLEPIKSYLRLSNVEPRHSHILPRLQDGDEYNLGNMTISKSGTFQVRCAGEKFKGYQHIYLDDKSAKKCQQMFYEDAVKPLVGEFVDRQRNICVILHGAEGSGRQRTLFGNTGEISRRSSSASRRVSATDVDDLSSLGCDGVSDVNNANPELERRASVPPTVVSFRNDLSSCCSKLCEIDESKKSECLPVLDDEDGIIPRILAETFHKLRQQYPTFVANTDAPQLVPKNRATPSCRFRTLSDVLTDDVPNVSVEFYTGENNSNSSLPLSTDGEGLISLRITCIEVVDDLASGECTVNDLLEVYKVPDDEAFLAFGEDDKQESSITAAHIRHDVVTGIVFVEDAVEMQCQGYAAALECLTMAEESRNKRNAYASYRDEDLFTDKLYHTIYLMSLEHRDVRTGATTISHQVVLSAIDESMSNSASMALHSSYLELSKMIDDISKFSGGAVTRQNALVKLLNETIGGECCTIAIGTVNAEDGEVDGHLPTLRLGEAMSWMYNTTDRAVNISPPKVKAAPSLGTKQSMKSEQKAGEFVPETNTFDGPKRLSQCSDVPKITPTIGEIQAAKSQFEPLDRKKGPRLNPTRSSFDDSNSSHRRVSKRASESSSQQRQFIPSQISSPCANLGLSLGSNSYCSFRIAEDEIGAGEPTRKSFISTNFADSDNPFVQQYAKELNKSWASRSSADLVEAQLRHSAGSHNNSSYDPLRDAKFYLAEIEAMDANGDQNVPAPQLAARNTAAQSSWRDMSNEIESKIETTRKRMMERMKQQSLRKPIDYALDLPPMPRGMTYQDSPPENRFPPEYVSVEISSHGSSERHQLAIDEMEETYRTAVADVQRALKRVQTEKDELIKEKTDNFFELQKAREEVNRLKAINGSEKSALETQPGQSFLKYEPGVSCNETASKKPSGTVPIQVILRVRPLNKLERHCRQGYSCIDVSTDSHCVIKSPFDHEDVTTYQLDKVFGTDSSNQQIYSRTAEACLPKFMSGISSWVLVYGLRSSGKSYTLGTSPDSCEAESNNDGIIPRFSKELFQEMKNSDKDHTFTLKCTVVGLYLEQLYDLLNPQTKYAPFLSESPDGINIVGATEAFCFEEAEIMQLVHRAHAFRDSLVINMNLDFRYFHTFFVFNLEQYNAAKGQHTSSKMWFADIAASHTIDSASKTTESRIFQRGLGIVGGLVDSLNGRSATADYRASKLSSLLKDAFVGSSFTTSIITASPSAITLADTMKAIEFGRKLQRINKATDVMPPAENELSTGELKDKYMTVQSEMLVWRQLANDLTKKNLQMMQALRREQEQIEKLTEEKIRSEEEMIQRRSSLAGSSLHENYSLNEMKDALSLFDGDHDGDHPAETDSLEEQEVETKSVTSDYEEHEVETKSVRSKSSSIRSRKSSKENPFRNKNASFLASMTTSAGMSSLGEEIEENDQDILLLGDCNPFGKLMTPHTSAEIDFDNVDTFFFLSEIEKSFPKMNVIRGKHSNKCTIQDHPNSLHDKGSKQSMGD